MKVGKINLVQSIIKIKVCETKIRKIKFFIKPKQIRKLMINNKIYNIDKGEVAKSWIKILYHRKWLNIKMELV